MALKKSKHPAHSRVFEQQNVNALERSKQVAQASEVAVRRAKQLLEGSREVLRRSQDLQRECAERRKGPG